MQLESRRTSIIKPNIVSNIADRWRYLAFFATSLIVLGALIAGLIALSIAIAPASAVPDAPTRLKLQNDIRVTLLQAIGGILLVFGAYFTWRQLQLSRDQLRQSLDASTAQLQLNVQTQINEQFSRTIEQLGHDKAGVRVGAVYALEQIARSSPEARPGIHELLAAYIRAEARWSLHHPVTLIAIEPDPTPDDPPELPLLKIRAPDVQAGLTALGRRMECPGEVIELQSTDLRVSYLGGANLRGAILGRAMLTLSDLTDADLSEAWLRRTNFRGSILINCNLRKAVLRDAILREADLTNADLRAARTCLLRTYREQGSTAPGATTPPSGPTTSTGHHLVLSGLRTTLIQL